MKKSPLFQTVRQVFEQQGWTFSEVEGREVLNAGFEAQHTRVHLHVQVFPEMNAVSVVAESARKTGDPARRERLAELILRVNTTLTVGGFEMIWEEGQLLFRLTNLFSGEEGDPAIVEGMVRNVIAEMDRISPAEAMIHRCEGPELAGIDIRRMAEHPEIPEIP